MGPPLSCRWLLAPSFTCICAPYQWSTQTGAWSPPSGSRTSELLTGRLSRYRLKTRAHWAAVACRTATGNAAVQTPTKEVLDGTRSHCGDGSAWVSRDCMRCCNVYEFQRRIGQESCYFHELRVSSCSPTFISSPFRLASLCFSLPPDLCMFSGAQPVVASTAEAGLHCAPVAGSWHTENRQLLVP